MNRLTQDELNSIVEFAVRSDDRPYWLLSVQDAAGIYQGPYYNELLIRNLQEVPSGEILVEMVGTVIANKHFTLMLEKMAGGGTDDIVKGFKWDQKRLMTTKSAIEWASDIRDALEWL